MRSSVKFSLDVQRDRHVACTVRIPTYLPTSEPSLRNPLMWCMMNFLPTIPESFRLVMVDSTCLHVEECLRYSYLAFVSLKVQVLK